MARPDRRNERQQTEEPPQPAKPPRCGTCHYCTTADICHRFPPQVVTAGAYTSNACQPKVNTMIGWCGEWKQKETR